MKEKGAIWCEVTLHVGAGTFNPVRVDCIYDHQMHCERYHISPNTCRIIQEAKAEGRRVISIGTTTLRCLEGSALANGGQIQHGFDETSIFITPGNKFNVIDIIKPKDETFMNEKDYLDINGIYHESWRVDKLFWNNVNEDELKNIQDNIHNMLENDTLNDFICKKEKIRKIYGQSIFIIAEKRY